MKRTITACIAAIALCSCIDLDGFDFTSPPIAKDVVGEWHGFVANAYARFEFIQNGTGFAAIGMPGTNITSEAFNFKWQCTSSNLLIEADSSDTHEMAVLHGRILEGTLLLEDPSQNGGPIGQIIRADDASRMDRKLNRIIKQLHKK